METNSTKLRILHTSAGDVARMRYSRICYCECSEGADPSAITRARMERQQLSAEDNLERHSRLHAILCNRREYDHGSKQR